MGVETSFKGEVTCYLQDGNRAAFSGVVTKASDNMTAATFFVEVVDNGEGAGVTAPDAFRVLTPDPNNNPADCPFTNQSGAVVTHGNIQVHEE